jgi:hypothetical protein
MIAQRYVNETIVVGYNLLAAPDEVSDNKLEDFYTRLITEIRLVDNNHILFLEGNSMGEDFDVFSNRW